MRTAILPTALFLFSTAAHAQLSAGEVPAGSSAYQVNIDLVLNAEFDADSAELELDCDDFMDAWAMLFRGEPEIDVPHVASLQFVDDNIEVCMDMGSTFQQRPKYYAFGEALDCSGDFDWQIADQLVLGDLGGFMATGPWLVDSMYIAYRQGSNMGWILLSLDLVALGEVRLQIHELLSVCQTPTSVARNEIVAPLLLHPNPNNGEAIRVESTKALRQLELLDATGRLVAQYSGNVRSIDAPEIAGCYFVRTVDADGQRSVARLVRR